MSGIIEDNTKLTIHLSYPRHSKSSCHKIAIYCFIFYLAIWNTEIVTKSRRINTHSHIQRWHSLIAILFRECVRWLLIFLKGIQCFFSLYAFISTLIQCDIIDWFQFIYRHDSSFVVCVDFAVLIYNSNGENLIED